MRVKARAEAIGTMRFVSVFFMETLAAWTPTTPEMEVKTLFGRHIWLMAQQADALGKRTHELRAALHYSRSPSGLYFSALQRLRAVTATAQRLTAFYDIALGTLVEFCNDYFTQNDSLVDEPSFVILGDIIQRVEKMKHEREELVREFPKLNVKDGPELVSVSEFFVNADCMVDYSQNAGAAAE